MENTIPRGVEVLSNRLFWAALAGILFWFADQPTVEGYNPLVQMLWEPGLWKLPTWDFFVLLFSWLVTALFCHFLLFTMQKLLHRGRTGE
jgi:hypothetical protein